MSSRLVPPAESPPPAEGGKSPPISSGATNRDPAGGDTAGEGAAGGEDVEGGERVGAGWGGKRWEEQECEQGTWRVRWLHGRLAGKTTVKPGKELIVVAG